MRVSRIVMHRKPHLDEFAANWALRKFGNDDFPEVASAKIEFVDAGSEPPDGLTAEDWEEKGTLAFGVWGGRLDEHANNGRERKKGECSFSLILKHLDIIGQFPALDNMMEYVKRHDLGGQDVSFGLGKMVNLLHNQYPDPDQSEEIQKWVFEALDVLFQDRRESPSGDISLQRITALIREQYPDNPQRAYDWFKFAMEAYCASQTHFFGLIKDEFEQKAEVIGMIGPKGHKKKVVVISSDSDQIKDYAFHRGVDADCLILRKTSGHTMIFTSPHSGLLLGDVFQIIRLVEKSRFDGGITAIDLRKLADEGSENGWYLAAHKNCLMNGGKRNENVPPTKLTLKEIIQFVRIGIDPNFFSPDRQEQCRSGICNAKEVRCSFHIYGLPRCRRIRTTQATLDLKHSLRS